MGKLIMNVDVDLVVVDTLSTWLQWFKENSRDNIDFNMSWHNGSYHLSQTMREHMDIDPDDFWRQDKLYDNAYPMDGAVDVLKRLSERYEIRFISHSMAEHKHSKSNFLARFFEFHDGVYHVDADEKWEFAADVWVEDRVSTLDTLVQTQPDCTVFQMVNDMNREFIVQGAKRVTNWYDIARYLK